MASETGLSYVTGVFVGYTVSRVHVKLQSYDSMIKLVVRWLGEHVHCALLMHYSFIVSVTDLTH